MWLGRLSVEVEGTDNAFVVLHIELLFGNFLGVESDKFVDASDVEALGEFLVDLAAVSLIYPHTLNSLLIKFCFLLQSNQKIGNGSISRYQNLVADLKQGQL